jgi:hypothetical protein
VECAEGHKNAEGQTFCGTCGRRLGATYDKETGDDLRVGDLTSDGFFVAMSAIGLACVVMFVAALVGAGQANTLNRFDTYAYLSSVGSATWLIAALIAWGLAAWRVNIMRGL